MSAVSPSHTAIENHRDSKILLWISAGMSPILLSPLWLVSQNPAIVTTLSFSSFVLLILIGAATFTDLKLRKIFNWTTYTAAVWGLAINVLPSPFSLSSIGISESFGGMIVCFIVMLIPYTLARGGAGDVKLAAAIGSIVGIADGLLVIAFAYIIAATSLCVWTVWSQGPRTLGSALFRSAASRIMPQRVSAPTKLQINLLQKPIPLAGFFAVATLMILLDVPEFLRSL